MIHPCNHCTLQTCTNYSTSETDTRMLSHSNVCVLMIQRRKSNFQYRLSFVNTPTRTETKRCLKGFSDIRTYPARDTLFHVRQFVVPLHSSVVLQDLLNLLR